VSAIDLLLASAMCCKNWRTRILERGVFSEKLPEIVHQPLLLPSLGVDSVRKQNMNHFLIYYHNSRGYKTLTQIPDVKLMVHVKAWEGLLESSWMFLIQVWSYLIG
jgi:hypothetical protein